MLILLYGPDSYRRQQKLKEYIDRYKAKYQAFSLNRFYFDREEDWDSFKDFSKAQSLFEPSRLGVISEIGDLEEKDQKELAKILKENLETKDLTLIIESDKKPVKEFSFLLKKPAISWKFENLAGEESQKFIRQEAEKRNLDLDKESQNLLGQVYGGDSWGLITELDKLSLLDADNIGEKVLKNHLGSFSPVNIFDTINQIRNSGSLSARLSLLEEFLSRNKDAAMIFNILAISPYADPKWKNKVADYDAAVKSGKLEYEEVLLDLVLGY